MKIVGLLKKIVQRWILIDRFRKLDDIKIVVGKLEKLADLVNSCLKAENIWILETETV